MEFNFWSFLGLKSLHVEIHLLTTWGLYIAKVMMEYDALMCSSCGAKWHNVAHQPLLYAPMWSKMVFLHSVALKEIIFWTITLYYMKLSLCTGHNYLDLSCNQEILLTVTGLLKKIQSSHYVQSKKKTLDSWLIKQSLHIHVLLKCGFGGRSEGWRFNFFFYCKIFLTPNSFPQHLLSNLQVEFFFSLLSVLKF